MVQRQIFFEIQEQLELKKSVLVLGPRQVGKTTLAESFRFHVEINLARSKDRIEYEKDPDLLTRKIQTFKKSNPQVKTPLIYIDEVQLVPELFGEIQVLVDKKLAQFLLTGSSARKLRAHANVNLIPGRVVNLRLDPFSIDEYPQDVEDILIFGQLPEIATTEKLKQKSLLLRSYVENYIEEEIRKETRIRNVANFSRFIELAAIQAGEVCNFSEISKELGPTVMTIQSYFQILEDTLFAERVDPYLKNSTRKKLTKSSRYLFYDLGVRRIASKEGSTFLPDRKGKLFEQLVGMEILKWIRSHSLPAQLYFWRDLDGPEVDWLVELNGQLLPVEVKLSKKIHRSDARHLRTFMSEYKEAKLAVVINDSSLNYDLEKNIEVVGFSKMHEFLNKFFRV